MHTPLQHVQKGCNSKAVKLHRTSTCRKSRASLNSRTPGHRFTPPPQCPAVAGSSVTSPTLSCDDASSLLALKEWAVACSALAAGDQTILMRKGGVKEGIFKPKASAFVMFPTGFHSDADLLKPQFHNKFNKELAYDPKAQNPLVLSTFGQITGAWTYKEGAAALEALSDFHVWNDSFLEVRLKWRGQQPLTILEIRAFTLGTPLTLTPTEDLFGCFSWVDLSTHFPSLQLEDVLSSASPALSDEEFAQRQDRLRQVLGGQVPAQPLPGFGGACLRAGKACQ